MNSEEDSGAWSQERLREEVDFAILPIGRMRREVREVAFAIELDRLRRGLQRMLDGDYPNPRHFRDHGGKCQHGTWYYKPCEECDVDWLNRLLSGNAP